MKRKFLLVLAVLCALLIIPATAQAATIVDSGECGAQGDNVTWTLDSEGTLTIKGSGNMYDMGYSNQPWYDERGSIKKVVINNGVNNIGTHVFYDCDFTSVIIPDSVASIGDSAFERCRSLTSITIPNSVTSIGNHVFQECRSLTSITIPNSVTSIGYYAFFGCTSLTSITIPNSVMSIGESTFSRCSLKSVTIPDGVTSIGDRAFEFCSSLESITIPNSVTSIGSSAFFRCSRLKSVTIPDGVTSISSGTFYGCSSLTNITIPDSVTNIADDFEDTAYYKNDKNWDNGVLYIGNHLIKAQLSITDCFIKDTTLTIADCAFQNCKDLQRLTIPDSVVNIGGCAFSECNSLKSVTIPNSVISIGYQAFEDCTSLYEITIPNSVTSIGNSAFYGCNVLGNITLSDSIQSIGIAAFGKTAYYENEDNWENGILYIDNHLIKAQDTVTDFSIRENTITLADSALRFCFGLQSITIPRSVKSIGDFNFDGCRQLTDVYYGGSIEDWNIINIGWFNDKLLNSTIYYKNPPWITNTEIINTASGAVVNVNLADTEYDSTLITAFYKNGIFTDLETTTISTGDLNKDISIPEDIDADEVKVFIWDGFKSMRPLCETKIVSIEQ